MNQTHSSDLTVPTQNVGPIPITSTLFTGEVTVPLSTFETPLWPSVNRGARVARQVGSIHTVLTKDCMTRSILLEAHSAHLAYQASLALKDNTHHLRKIIESTSNHIHLEDVQFFHTGNLLYCRIAINAQNASGHNMVTKAADASMQWILENQPDLKYVSISGNMCCDKKNSAINALFGRGKEVIAELVIPEEICQKTLRVSAYDIHNLNLKKNLLGSVMAGSVRSANAHFANMLLAIYLSTGQDAANIVEGSQGIVQTDLRDQSLYFSVTLPNIIVGTVGNGKDSPQTQHNLRALGCADGDPKSSQKLATIIAATVLCGELSLLAAQCNPGELMRAHLSLERKKKRKNNE
jgi:hydroxymethylglutaryl-CoA reductase (NADPH)